MKPWLQSIAKTLGVTSPNQPDGNDNHILARTVILAIDDDVEFLGSLRDMLEAQDFQLLTASSGAKGLGILNNTAENPQVLLLDYEMPQLDGEAILIQARRVRPYIKVIALTGTPDHQLPDNFCHGVDKLISKPFRLSELITSIQELAILQAAAPGPPRKPAASPSQPSKSRPDIPWDSLHCACGRVIQLSPNFKAPHIHCDNCGRMIRIG